MGPRVSSPTNLRLRTFQLAGCSQSVRSVLSCWRLNGIPCVVYHLHSFVCQVLEPLFQITVAFPGSPTRESCWDRLNSGSLTCGCSLLSDTDSSALDNMFPVTIIVFRAILNDKRYSCPLQICKPEESLFGQNIDLGLRLMGLFLENCHSLLFFGWGFPPLYPHHLPGSYK